MDVTDLLLRRRELMMGKKSQSILPSGYLECEYIEGTSSLSTMSTNVSGISTWLIDVYHPNKTGGNQIVIGRYDSGSNWLVADDGASWGPGANKKIGSCSVRTIIEVEFTSNGLVTTNTATGVSIDRTGSARPQNTIDLFGWNNKYKYTGRMYSAKCIEGGSFDGIPAKRVSDGAFGLYDIANGVFYGGSGYTGVLKT